MLCFRVQQAANYNRWLSKLSIYQQTNATRERGAHSNARVKIAERSRVGLANRTYCADVLNPSGLPEINRPCSIGQLAIW